MNKVEMDKLRSSVLYENEVLKVRYLGKMSNFPKGQVIEAVPKFATKSNLPYPQPKWMACCYTITDLDGDSFEIAEKRYGKLYKGFEWVL
ncbi:hypothetical protein KM792_13665 [Clostridium tyrobutyricum]|uniref:hypothetical protein n=1 Tax=Clostridium tyrobutyricum TaxID=1519 RepID=UPI0010AA59C7|nr:hypothetical protein [Clostridium tyrobutyricum]MBV4450692.1 hypothetical protein [Clostridium tyrobutyricum]QCH28489.1 hypothetical protein EZN00_02093 [Clostridium tyrobutyricum]